MTAPSMLTLFGQSLTEADYSNLAARWITPGIADAAGLRRVDSSTGREMFGRKQGNVSGIIIPNLAPWDQTLVREYRERLDNPDLEYRTDGSIHETRKYLQPPQRPNLIYFAPGCSIEVLHDVKVPIVVTEGEFKCLALSRLAMHNSNSRRFLPIALAGVWNFRGVVAKTTGRNGDRCDVKGIIPDIQRIVWKERKVIIAYDADAEQNPKVRAARWQLTSALLERGAVVGVLEWPIAEGRGIDDRLTNIGPDKVLADINAVEFGDWRLRLLRNQDGKMITCYDNVALTLEQSPEWRNVLGYNELTAGYFLLKQPPQPVTAEAGTEIEDHFDTEVVRYLERMRLMVKPDVVRRVVDAVARRNCFHPVREYLQALPKWDGKPRIQSWLLDYCGVEYSEAKPNKYARTVGEKFLISAVKRIMEPGAKCDSVLVLEGHQGIGKSTVGRILASDEWFSDQLADMGEQRRIPSN